MPKAPVVPSGLLLAALAFTAGTVDGLSVLGLDRVFTANMTGNVVLLGVSAGRGLGADTLRSATALAGFAAGTVAGHALAGPRPGWGRRTRAALGAELALLAAFALLWDAHAPRLAVIAVAGAAMGLQGGVVNRVGVSGVSATYVTGTLAAFLGQVSELTRPDASAARRFGVVLAMAGGAVTAALALRWDAAAAPWIAVAVVLAALPATKGART
ncbi:YoaK family protein [Actinomadura hibisca]|uniref:YoaK family protein n=1 Tax=Actinomadura hibisca TaxID=68565 RepID=UPI00082B334E|nr:YoaK family protein [Actinomadura hibisca]